MTNGEIRAVLAAIDLPVTRSRAGVGMKAVADALGVPPMTVWRWEQRHTVPAGPQGASYARIMTGLARHLEVAGG